MTAVDFVAFDNAVVVEMLTGNNMAIGDTKKQGTH